MTLPRLFGVVAVLGAIALNASAWVAQPGDVWPDGEVPVAFEFGGNPPLPQADLNAAAADAIAAWNGLLQRIRLVSIPPDGAPWYDNGRNELFFDTTFYGEPFPSGVLAITATSFDGDTRVEADIVFNSTVAWDIYNGPLRSAIDFRRVATHELGHVLGLSHPDQAAQRVSAIMNSTVSGVEAPTTDDQTGIRALYDRGSNAPPQIVAGPTVDWTQPTAGMRVKLEAEAGGRGPYSYTWRRDGVAVPNGSAATLVLDPVTMSDAGNYTIEVRNASAGVTSPAVSVNVRAAQPPTLHSVIAAPPRPEAGDSFTLEANDIVAGSGPMTYVWKRNGVVVGTTTVPYLALNDVQFSDTGDYTATASNIAGSVTSAPIHVTVTPGSPPQFESDAGPITATIGDAVWFAANATGSGTLRYQWAKNGIAIPNATNSSLSIPSFQSTDAGAYTVTVTNSFGAATSAVYDVAPKSGILPPVIVQHPESVTDYAGASISFTFVAEGDNLQYRWFKDGAPYTPAPGTQLYQDTLSLPQISPSDAGFYALEVSNTAGKVISRPARLTVLPAQAPVFTEQPGPYAGIPGDRVTLGVYMLALSAAPTILPNVGYTFQWLKDGVPLNETSDSMTISSATEADSGEYSVRARSVTGQSAESHAVKVVIKAGPRPPIGEEPGDSLYDTESSEIIRLVLASMAAQQQQRASNPSAPFIAEVSASGPSVEGLSPGTYVTTAVTNGQTVTGTPFTIGFVPVTAPVITRGPASHTADIGEQFALTAVSWAHGAETYQWSKDGVPIPGATGYALNFAAFTADQTGSYTVAATSAAGTTVSEPAVVDLRPALPPEITQPPSPVVANAGDGARFTISAIGGTLRYQWTHNGAAIPGATGPELWLYPVGAADAGSYAVTVWNGSNLSVSSHTVSLRVVERLGAPRIICPPQSTVADLNGEATLAVGAIGGPLPDHYQWRKDGVDIPGANDAELRLHHLQAQDGGTYTVVATNASGSVTSPPAVLTVDTAGRLVNLAARAQVGTGANVLIAGFVIGGTTSRTVLVRGIGDQLPEFGVHGVLRNPLLQLFDANSKLLASSDNWSDGSDTDAARNARIAALRAAEAETGAFPLTEGSLDGALIATLPPGNYSAEVSGVVNTTGVGLVEIYELGTPSRDRMINMSCRSHVGVGDEVLITGLSIRGGSPRRVLVRAIGPSLTRFGVSGALPDPQVSVYRDQDVIAENDNWSDQLNASELLKAENAVGAFPLDAGSKDAAVLLDLAPGSYTIHVSGVNESTGVAIVEVYEVP